MKFYSAYIQNSNNNIKYGILDSKRIDPNRQIFFSPETNFVVQITPDGVSFRNYGSEWDIFPLESEARELDSFLPQKKVEKVKESKPKKVAKKRKK